MSLPVSNVDAIPHGHTTAIITTTANQLQDGISEKLCLLIQNISLAISAIVVAFVFSWLLASVTLAGLVFVILVYCFTTYALVNRWNEMVEADREGAAVAGETIASIRMVAACGAEGKMVETYAGWVRKAAERGQKMSKWIAVQSSLGKLRLRKLNFLKRLTHLAKSFSRSMPLLLFASGGLRSCTGHSGSSMLKSYSCKRQLSLTIYISLLTEEV